MKNVFLFLVLYVIGFSKSQAQKAIIDSAAIISWPLIGEGESETEISSKGSYVLYKINNRPVGGRTLFLQSSRSGEKMEFVNYEYGKFTRDERFLVVKSDKDSIYKIEIETGETEAIGDINSFKILRLKDRDLLACQSNKNSTDGYTLSVVDFSNKIEAKVYGVTRYVYLEGCNSLVAIIHRKVKDSSTYEVRLHNFEKRTKDALIEDKVIQNYAVDLKGTRVLFVIVDAKEEGTSKEIWYYKAGMEKAVQIYRDIDDRIYSIAEQVVDFNKDGSLACLYLKRKDKDAAIGRDSVAVDIWNYKDTVLHEEQSKSSEDRRYAAVIDLMSRRLLLVDDDSLQVRTVDELSKRRRYVIVTKKESSDFWWNDKARGGIYLKDIRSGEVRLLADTVPYASQRGLGLRYEISSAEKYVIHFDPLKGDYFVYNIETGMSRNVTAGIRTCWIDLQSAWAAPKFARAEGVAGWLKDDKAVLVYDNFDIWRIDPDGSVDPICVTRGYGKAHHIKFRVVGQPEGEGIDEYESLLLSAFDTATKYSGFYRLSFDKALTLRRLSMDPIKNGELRRSEDGKNWMLTRQNAVQSPNLFVTKDFIKYKQISFLNPHEGYNWLRAELVSWRLPDSSYSQGILYKPEDFDSSRRYPLLINYYEKLSDELFQYRLPQFCSDNMNVPYFVSRGYVVFLPDIHYESAPIPGQAALNSVLSGAHYLARYKWIDSLRMGVQGHSFGGTETNYIITHTKLFAAACEAAGRVDEISSYGGLYFFGESSQSYYENYQGRIRSTLWRRPEWYIESSSILKADQIQTPLLMMHNRDDFSVPWSQGVQLFTALRRLGKKAWMLQYEGGGHTLFDVHQRWDYTVRMTQFFDHYLCGRPAPVWMTRGIPFKLKGVERGYELDQKSVVP